jgi:hypothetical protein
MKLLAVNVSLPKDVTYIESMGRIMCRASPLPSLICTLEPEYRRIQRLKMPFSLGDTFNYCSRGGR